MRQKRSAIMLVTLLVTIAAGAALWSINWMFAQRANALRAADDLSECTALVREIESLRSQPTVAAAEAIDTQEMGQRIAEAARQAGLGAQSLEGIFPQTPRRLGDSAYLSKPTVLSLRGVTLAQLATFLHHLTDQSGLTAADIRLRAPVNDASGALWDVETTLTYLIYAPVSTARVQP